MIHRRLTAAARFLLPLALLASSLAIAVAPTPAAADTVDCIGDGTSGPRIQAVYVRWANAPDRYASQAPRIRDEWAPFVSGVFEDSAVETGAHRRLRWVHDGSCRPTVLNIEVPAGTAFPGGLGSALTDPDIGALTDDPGGSRKYAIWADRNPGDGTCGSRATNPGGLAWVGEPCWGPDPGLMAHELMHAMGAVAASASHHNPEGHCWDGYDRMCRNDRSEDAREPDNSFCPDPRWQNLFDCNHDDYFDANPTPGSGMDNSTRTGGGNNVALNDQSRFFEYPQNDRFRDPADLPSTSSGSVTGTNVDASKSPGEPWYDGNGGGRSVWYRWQAPATGTVTFHTVGSSIDTLLAAYRAAPDEILQSQATPMGENDDQPNGIASRLSFAVEQGAWYRIGVDGKDGATGNVALNWDLNVLDATLTIAQAASPAGGPTFSYTTTGAGLVPFTLGPGQSRTFPSLAPGSFSVTQTGVADWPLTGLACNTSESVSLASRRADLTLSDDDHTTCTFTNSGPDLRLALTVDEATASSDEVLHYRVTVTNAGGIALTGVGVTDPRAPGCAATIGTLAVGEVRTVSCSLTLSSADVGTVTNVATADSDQTAAVLSNSVSTGVQVAPALRVIVSADETVVGVGQPIHYHVQLRAGERALTGVTTVSPRLADCARAIGDLAAGETRTIDCSFTPTATGTFTAVVAARATGVPSHNSAPVAVRVQSSPPVVVGAPALTATLTADETAVAVGDAIHYHVVVRNTGDRPLTGIAVADPRVPGCAAAVGALAVGASHTIDCSLVTTAAHLGGITNVAGASSDQTRSVNTNPVRVGVGVAASTPPSPGHPAASITLAATESTVALGSPVHFQVTIANTGDRPLTGVGIIDPRVPACAGPVADLAVGESRTVHCLFTPTSAGRFTNVAAIDTTQTDPVNSAPVTVRVT